MVEWQPSKTIQVEQPYYLHYYCHFYWNNEDIFSDLVHLIFPLRIGYLVTIPNG
jgi:hypothetical protein